MCELSSQPGPTMGQFCVREACQCSIYAASFSTQIICFILVTKAMNINPNHKRCKWCKNLTELYINTTCQWSSINCVQQKRKCSTRSYFIVHNFITGGYWWTVHSRGRDLSYDKNIFSARHWSLLATKRSLFSRIFLCETNLNVGDRRLSVYCEAHQPSLPGHFTLKN